MTATLDPALTPNLFIVGASKTGTSSLHPYLAHHPEIVGADPKEPCYFVDQDELALYWPTRALEPLSFDPAAYGALFEGGREAAYRLESSVYYSQAPFMTGIPERIAKASPGAKIIYVVRHPVTRAVSHYWQRFRELLEDKPIEEAVTEGSIYVATSSYAMQLKLYLEHFPKAQVHVVLSEDLRVRRKAVLDETFAFLGLPPLEMDAVLERERHQTAPDTRVPRFSFVKGARDSAAWQAVRKHLPMRAIKFARSAAVRKVPRAAFDDSVVRARLTAYFEAQAGDLDALTGRDFEARWFQKG